MAMLPVDTTTTAWRQVREYAQERRAELAVECCAIGTLASRREELAARIAELDELVSAPDITKQAAEMRLNHQPRETY